MIFLCGCFGLDPHGLGLNGLNLTILTSSEFLLVLIILEFLASGV